MKQLCLFVSFVFASVVHAQEKIFVINPGQRISDVITVQEMFAYPTFANGTVFFNDGSTADARLNYNMAFGEMQFINPKGDTLSLADEGKIKMITINADTFHFNNGYVQSLAGAGNAHLARRTRMHQVGSSKVGLYDQEVQGGAASSYGSVSSGAHDANLIVSQRTTFKKETIYYFEDRNGRLQIASRKTAEKVFSDKKGAINDYLSKNNVDFKNEADLRSFVAYLSAH